MFTVYHSPFTMPYPFSVFKAQWFALSPIPYPLYPKATEGSAR